jgi:Mrp family chromosome partitioning ATPase
MSRNFELLYQVGRAEALLGPDVEARMVSSASDLEPSAVPAVEMPTASPTLQIDGLAREEVTKLVHRLFLLSSAEGTRHVVFAGMERGDGCTWICAHAAEILASQTRGSVCVVDCDLRFPALHRQFGLENHYGFSDALLGEGPIREYARPLSRPNLWLVTSGMSSANAEEVLTSDRMRRRLSELRAEFRYVLMDVGPLNTSNYAMVLGGLTDGVVLVLKANASRRDSARETIQQLHALHVRMLGAVLNQRTFPIPERVYKRL